MAARIFNNKLSPYSLLKITNESHSMKNNHLVP